MPCPRQARSCAVHHWGGSSTALPGTVMNCTVSSAAMAAWKASVVPGATVPLEWEFAPISDVIDDTEIKTYV